MLQRGRACLRGVQDRTSQTGAARFKAMSGICQRSTSAASGEAAVKTSKHGDHVFVITLNRPDKRNAVDVETASLLTQSFRAFEEDPQSRVAVLTGSGGTFCAGFDLSFLANIESQPAEKAREIVAGAAPHLGPMGPSRYHMSKPLIAAVSGHAVAGGLELALLADMRVAEETAIFGVFCRRFGVPLIDGGSVRLPRLIGLSRAMDMILTGRAVKAQEALDIGLANRVVPHGKALQAALELAEQISMFPQDAMLTDRKSALDATYGGLTLAEALAKESEGGFEALQKGLAWNNAKGFVSGVGRHGDFSSFKPGSKL